MAQLLTRHGIVDRIYKIIDEAKRELVLISPYIKMDEDTKTLLKEKAKAPNIFTNAIAIHVIYGKEDLNEGQKSFFEANGIKVYFRKNLHAKCYLNDKEALVTSLNLYEFSQEHNDEMGILVTKKDDKQLYEEIYTQAMRWKVADNKNAVADNKNAVAANGKAKSAASKSSGKSRPSRKEKPSVGYCIRCKAKLSANPKKPYCADCYKTWERYSDHDYEDKYCHICGSEHTATLRRPLCGDCYRKYKDQFDFAVV